MQMIAKAKFSMILYMDKWTVIDQAITLYRQLSLL